MEKVDHKITKHEFIIALIKAEMKNRKLLLGLDNAGVQTEDFHTDLGLIILKLIGFRDVEKNDDLYDYYEYVMNGFITGEVKSFLKMQDLISEEMYKKLLLQKAA